MAVFGFVNFNAIIGLCIFNEQHNLECICEMLMDKKPAVVVQRGGIKQSQNEQLYVRRVCVGGGDTGTVRTRDWELIRRVLLVQAV